MRDETASEEKRRMHKDGPSCFSTFSPHPLRASCARVVPYSASRSSGAREHEAKLKEQRCLVGSTHTHTHPLRFLSPLYGDLQNVSSTSVAAEGGLSGSQCPRSRRQRRCPRPRRQQAPLEHRLALGAREAVCPGFRRERRVLSESRVARVVDKTPWIAQDR